MKSTGRTQKAKYNIATSLMLQVVSLVCGIIVPRLMIRTFGSEVYGATSSIAHFLAYISLVEGGVASVARAALYKPLAENDIEKISAVTSEIKRFFRIVAGVFVVYVIVLAFSYHSIAKSEALDWMTSFYLVIVISLSAMAQYYFGITNTVLLNADQRVYITNLVSVVFLFANTLVIIITINLGMSIIFVKLASSVVFIVKPLVLYFIVHRKYKLKNVPRSEKPILNQKWSGFGQHIAYFLHSNTDAVILTAFVGLKSVAIYSVYSMIVSSVRSVVSGFLGGMEPVFGNMYAKGETDYLKNVFNYYETLISVVATIFFSTTAVLIVPFVKLYTAKIEDANYIVPLFSLIMIVEEYIYCLRAPYHQLTMAANRFKQTRVAAYGEAVINIVLSLVLVFKFELIGVVLATLIAVSFRMIYYVWYLSKNIIQKKLSEVLKRQIINLLTFAAIYFAAGFVIGRLDIPNYFIWTGVGFVQFLFACIVVLAVNYLFYKEEVRAIISKFSKKYAMKRKQ